MASKRATCPVKQIGAVFVDRETHSILSLGYNGSPRKTIHCGQACRDRKIGENSESCLAVHAEMNAIFNAALNGIQLKNSGAYLTLSPCFKCSQALVQVGVRKVVWKEEYPNKPYRNLFSQAGIWFYGIDWPVI